MLNLAFASLVDPRRLLPLSLEFHPCAFYKSSFSHRRVAPRTAAWPKQFRSVYQGDCLGQHAHQPEVPIWPLTWRKCNPPQTHTKISRATPRPTCSTRTTSTSGGPSRSLHLTELEIIIERRPSTGEMAYQMEATLFPQARSFTTQTLDPGILALLVEAPLTAPGAHRTQRVCFRKTISLRYPILISSRLDTSHVPCKFFKIGQCQAGKACPFSHSTDTSKFETPCKYFAKV